MPVSPGGNERWDRREAKVAVRLLLVEDFPQMRSVLMDLLATVGAFQKGADLHAFIDYCQAVARARSES